MRSCVRLLGVGLLVAVGWLAALPAASAGEVVARAGRGRLERQDGQLVLYLKGSPYEMGYQHGLLLRDLVRRNMRAILDNRGALGREAAYKAYKVLRPVMHQRLRPFVPKRFRQEMEGLAAAVGLPYEDIEAGNLFPAAFHCSGMALMGKATKDGSLYHVRILDYLTKAGLQETAVVMDVAPEGKHRFLNVSFAGFIGSVTGMNAQKVTIGEMGGGGLGYWDGVPMPLLLRDALERAGTLQEAVEIFRRAERTCEYYYVISDAKIPDARGLWTTPSVFETVKPGETYGFFKAAKPRYGAGAGKAFFRSPRVEVTKNRILVKDRDDQVEGFVAIQPPDCVVLSGYDRYQHFMDRLMPRYGSVDGPMLQELIKRPVSMRSNLHCAIFHPDTGEVWVAVAGPGGSPACNQPYRRFKLQLEDEVARK